YIPSSGSEQLVSGAYYKDSQVNFSTAHFSDYAIVFESSSPSGGDDDNTAIVAIAAAAVAAAIVLIAGFYVIRNKQ
ncbi:MAG: hypothetical protein IKQ93_09405, partial [Candidatus Methanomethylophilaceae archaeon]|nr:hypothetical protein [Candidatus Methanomethylophilaceae archaeon]MBR6910464.1 hypothetical protein [Candidatus Methanomethylophilaceae archaeon]